MAKNSKIIEMSPSQKFKEFLARLDNAHGLKPAFVKKSLMQPWWELSFVKDEQGWLESTLYLGRLLGLPTKAALTPGAKIKSKSSSYKCKTSAGVAASEYEAAALVARAYATIAITASPGNATAPKSALDLRKFILKRFPVINLENTARTLWSVGIPVLHLWHGNLKTPHGFVFRLAGRYAIVLMRKKQHGGWLLFDLLHEVGHIGLGHLSEDCYIADRIDEGATAKDEAQANEYAREVLTRSSLRPTPIPNLGNRSCIRTAREMGTQFKIDPQWPIITSGGQTLPWAAVQASLNSAWPADNAVGTLKKALSDCADWDSLSRPDREFLGNLVGE